jgi:hypothetical protein
MIKEEEYLFYISGNTPSSKNGRVWTGNYFIASKRTQKWRKDTRLEFLGQALWFQYLASMLPRPLYVEYTFIRNSKHRFDYINLGQAIQDEMVGYLPFNRDKEKNSLFKGEIATCDHFLGQLYWIADDCMTYLKPYYGDFGYDKKHPGVIIRLLTEKPSI